MLRRRYICYSFLISLFILSNCAYFNTFYNAKNYFNRAETGFKRDGRITPQTRNTYEKAIEKCAKILKFYPTSKYVDDALLMMGISYYRIGEREKARRKFEELVTLYPESPLVPRAHLEFSKLLTDIGDYESAMKELDKIEGDEYIQDSELQLIRIYILQGRYSLANEGVKAFLSNYPESPLKKEALLSGADNAYKMKAWDDAEEFLKRYLELFLTESERVKGKELLGDVLREKGDFGDALNIYESIDLAPGSEERERINIKRALCYEELGDIEKTKEIYRDILDRKKTGVYAIEASYRLALLFESQDSTEEALALYEEAGNIYGESEYKKMSNERAKALKELQEVSEETDLMAQMRLAELYLMELNRPQEALHIYKSLLEDSFTLKAETDSSLFPKILYAIVYIRAKVLRDEDEAKEYYKILSEDFPESIYREEAEKNFGEAIQ